MGAKPKKFSNSATKWDKHAWLATSQHKDTSLATFVSPICDIKIAACKAGLHSISWEMGDPCDELKAREVWGDVTSHSGPNCQHIEEAAQWLRSFFRNPHQRTPAPKLCYGQVKAVSCIPIWEKLKDEVGLGETISYGQLAALCGNPKASRHVGYAMGHNSFGLVVPCHRVVTAGGALGNYCRGRKNPLKVWLHEHERAPPSAEPAKR
ncbi:methylated-DNA--protein-cysteine methyltransferase-like isoform X1 [Amphibalanus amphitrite]|uniref:methylated-DNA--protein-cysteine methyltransferase-like isoform X1 n=1 Tax=Amphibalanus amphitrite TaxID=1232801 RepID=UPI001C916B05|nr:methylated-DNA--protein-cysteine methyltransferase-like isoform X1 [Amphibalanus amphitrite]XP_043189721.1 methylated-DNA--protein-cysteine methyltransferase-like isoform X1 [Amphibalanus amphitrite]XP_043189722.1 methylated-DNA--protein-cysteine methyltransferase-like isoform X1 [Amphibalanus amphitrite]XP_043189723.1 methylated-DNA--protein-cysteine methyltransferase-like isoform X1 [Amphibalanus amphitrite]XP_043189724.1 methylated-DNA--protein-cysteine methyltransferase-like isoform X1 [